MRRFKDAGYGFLLLNLIYLALAIFFIPPFNIGLTTFFSLLAFFSPTGDFYILSFSREKVTGKISCGYLWSSFSIYCILPFCWRHLSGCSIFLTLSIDHVLSSRTRRLELAVMNNSNSIFTKSQTRLPLVTESGKKVFWTKEFQIA